MNIIVTATMRTGTFEAKFAPLSKIINIDKIFVLRKSKGPRIAKVEYILIPKIFQLPLLKIFLPIILAYYSKKYNASLILSYHFVPHAMYACIASLLTGIPFNYSQTGGKIQKRFDNPFWKIIISYILKRTLFINVPGDQSKKFWVSKGIPSSKIWILHSTIDTEKFHPKNQPAKYDFIYVGSLISRKGVERIIEEFYRICIEHQRAKMVIIGDGPLMSDLQLLSKEKGLARQIFFVGFQKDIVDWLNKSKIFIMASKIEGLPVALMEAMACSKVVIAPKIDNIPTAIKNNKTGFLFSEENDDLYHIMNYTYKNYDKFSFLRVNAREKIIKDHSYSIAINKWEKIFRRYNIVNEKN